MNLCALSAHDTMDRPQIDRFAVQSDLGEGRLVGVVGVEGNVVGRVPVLREEHMFEVFFQEVDFWQQSRAGLHG